MKRMREVFKFPVESCAFGSVYVDALASDDIKFPVVRAYIAHAVNHVDALADALEALIAASENHAANFKSEYFDAVDTLAAYRGEE